MLASFDRTCGDERGASLSPDPDARPVQAAAGTSFPAHSDARSINAAARASLPADPDAWPIDAATGAVVCNSVAKKGSLQGRWRGASIAPAVLPLVY